MIPALVSLFATALGDPATGVAVQLAAAPGVAVGVQLPASLVVVDELSTSWVARRTCAETELDAAAAIGAALVAVHADTSVDPDADAPDGVPRDTVRVNVTTLWRALDVADAAALLAGARHVERAIVRAVVAAFSTPLVTVAGVRVRVPFASDWRRLEGFEPWGDGVAGATTSVSLRVVDAWAYGLA